MQDRPEAIILEDDAGQLRALADLIGSAGLVAITARSASEALRLLDPAYHQPVIAIVDRDLSRAPDRSRRSDEVLRHIYEQHPSCTALVYSANLETVEARAQMHNAHPRVLLHDKREGDVSLLKRVRELVSATAGDLRLADGRVVHLPSGDGATHRVAVSLVMAYPGGRAVLLRTDAATRASRRFARWLEDVGSNMRVTALGSHMYRLEPRQ
jgi:hypothetical protein